MLSNGTKVFIKLSVFVTIKPKVVFTVEVRRTINETSNANRLNILFFNNVFASLQKGKESSAIKRQKLLRSFEVISNSK
jgi:hypothetical protein